MKIKDLIRQIMSHETLVRQPAVLVDIGASGALPREWEQLAPYAICIAFDPDEREMAFIQEKKSQFAKLIVINAIVTDTNAKTTDFYLTSSPFCSSSLPPDTTALADWKFSPLFKVESQTVLRSTRLADVLLEARIDQVDWFKTDAQGIDLRLFKSLGDLQSKVLVMNCEPGFIDAYVGEDKISETINYMFSRSFWLSSFEAKGTKRINEGRLSDSFTKEQLEAIAGGSIDSACWAELCFLNTFNNRIAFTVREYLLGCVFSIVLRQYGFAAELAVKGKRATNDPLFDQIISELKRPGNFPRPQTSAGSQSLLNRGLRKIARILNQMAG